MGCASHSMVSVPRMVTTRARWSPSSSRRRDPSLRAWFSRIRAIVPSPFMSRAPIPGAPGSFWARAKMRPPRRPAISAAFWTPGRDAMRLSEDSGKRHRSRSGSTGRIRFSAGPPSAGMALMVLLPAQTPGPLAAQHGGKVAASPPGQQLDVVLADARDGVGVAARQRDRRPRHLSAEGGLIPDLARQPPRGRAGDVPREAEERRGAPGALGDPLPGEDQLVANGALPLLGGLEPT